jgi:hypothetical protein
MRCLAAFAIGFDWMERRKTMPERSYWTRRRIATVGLIVVLCAVIVSVTDPSLVGGLLTRLVGNSATTPAKAHQEYEYTLIGLSSGASAVKDGYLLHPGDSVIATWRAMPHGLSTNSLPRPVSLTLYLYGPFVSASARSRAQDGVRDRINAIISSQTLPGVEPVIVGDPGFTDTWINSTRIATFTLPGDLRPGLYFFEEIAYARGGWATVSQTAITVTSASG